MSDKDLAKIRENIDSIDNDIIILLSKRFALAKEIAQFKQIGAVKDDARQDQIISRLEALAGEHKLKAELVDDLYKIIFKYSVEKIENVLSKNN